MVKRVALIADGSKSDLYACFCAVKLAKRMDASLFSILLLPRSDQGYLGWETGDGVWNEFSPSSLWQLISGLCSLEDVQASFHLLPKDSDAELVDFLVSNKVSCLIAGAADDDEFEYKKEWSSRIIKGVIGHSKWYMGNPTVFLAKPWNDESFRKILKQLSSDCSLYPIEIASV